MARPMKFDQSEAICVALESFWENGYEASSVKALSEAMGITRSSFYNAFHTREALFEQVVDLYCAGSPDLPFAQAPAQDIPVLITQTLKEICRVRAGDQKLRGCLIINTIAEVGGASHPVGRAMAGLVLGLASRIQELLDIAKAQGDIPQDVDTRAMALTLQTMIVGLNIMCRITPDEHDLQLVARTTLESLGLWREPP